MADEGSTSEKKAYPLLTSGVWWQLRERFKRAMPTLVDRDYIQTVLGVTVKSAGNYLGQLRMIGLVDAQGKPTDIARDWRLDDHYADACGAIVKNCYPAGLLEAVPDPGEDKVAAQRWFMRQGAGEGTARLQASFLALVSSAELSDTPATSNSEKKQTPRRPAKTTPKPEPSPAKSAEEPATKGRVETGSGASQGNAAPKGPDLHIDIQVHISADATPDQIDAVFASMAKHLYGR